MHALQQRRAKAITDAKPSRTVKILVGPRATHLPARGMMNVLMSNRLHWRRLLAFVTGLVNQELLLRNEYLLAENRILRAHLPARLRLTDPERRNLAEITKRVGRKTMKDIAQLAQPDTILGWFQRLMAAKFDVSAKRTSPGSPAAVGGGGRAGSALRAGEPRLGVRSHRGRVGQSGPPGVRSNGGQHFAPTQHRSGAGANTTTTWKEFLRSHVEVLAPISSWWRC